MKVLVVLALIVAIVFADQFVIDQKLINKINGENGNTWTAGWNEIFRGKTLSQVKNMLGTFLIVPGTDNTPVHNYATKAIPKAFDADQQWPNCKHQIRNQAQCGSCWAFSAAEALSDRLCIATNGNVNVVLSPQDMVSCDHSNYGCQGGYLSLAWRYLENTGIVSDKCFPYKSASGFVPRCPNRCDDSSQQWKKYKVKQGSSKKFGSNSAIQTDIMTNGPVQTGFSVYRDFFAYKSGVYRHRSGGLAGGHAVKINGWGVDNSGTPYWIVANSWGPTWGMNGFFWILRGSNECGFEADAWAGLAATN